jgi:hypothetical protein
VTKRVWVPDAVQPPPAAAINRLPPPPVSGPPPPAASIRVPPSGAAKPLPPNAAQRANDLQAYKHQLEEKLKSQQAVRHTGEPQKLNDMRRRAAAPLEARRLAAQRRQERLAALRREIGWRQAEIARLKARRERAGAGAAALVVPGGQDQSGQEDGGSKLSELQSALEQLIAALNQTEQEGEQEESEEASNEQQEGEPAAAGASGQWTSGPGGDD